MTITLDDETARWARLEAARRDTSVSRLVGDLLRRHMLQEEAYGRAERSYLGRPHVALSAPGARHPDRAELHER